ncbi:hypothetical protein ILUMI_23743 [Ignelater luminosus]|uniref:Uncharacterized protein n=1 Tax=Ignelater luminosus TaxID=2038154 RepID=A0A8K0CAD5_IGNLU|nr:hypothetical protein ILUMI_23743 [Ignelater luminosus]
MEESNANDDPYSFDGYDSDVDKEYLLSDLEERYTNQIHFHIFQEETVEETVSRQAEVNLNECANTKKKVVGPVNRSRKRKRDFNTKSLQGSHTKYCIPAADKQLVRDHVNSFPGIDSHYCRARTQREYVESTLNIKKMYELYVKFATEKQFVPKPKKDKCDVCKLNKLCTEEDRLTDEDKGRYQNHILEKNAGQRRTTKR